MPFGSIVISHNPVVSNPKGGKFNLNLLPTGIMRISPKSYVQVSKGTGGFYTCKFDIFGPVEQIGEMFDNGLARDVKTYNHFGADAWQGIITSMRQTQKFGEEMVTLEQSANKLFVRSTESRNRKTIPSAIENIPMQNHYGILELVETLDDPIVSTNRADSLAERLKEDLSDPYRQKEFRDRGDLKIPDGMAKLSIFCQGYYWYLTRRIINVTTRTSANASTVVAAILTARGQFVDTTSIETNTQQAYQQLDNDDIAWDVLIALAETGDTSDDRYIIGMYKDRRFVYEKRTDATIPNISLWKDSRNRITDKSGRPLAGMLVRPDAFLRNTNIRNRPGKVYSSSWDDPQVTYIGSVEYSEANQSVKLQTEVTVPRDLTGLSFTKGGSRRGSRGRGGLRGFPNA